MANPLFPCSRCDDILRNRDAAFISNGRSTVLLQHDLRLSVHGVCHYSLAGAVSRVTHVLDVKRKRERKFPGALDLYGILLPWYLKRSQIYRRILI